MATCAPPWRLWRTAFLAPAAAVAPAAVVAPAVLALRRRRGVTVTFASRSGLGISMPPRKPGVAKKYGDYCFRATCIIHDDSSEPLGCPIAKIKGYDKSPQVGKDTEEVCRMHLRTMDGGSALRCGEAEVVMLPHVDNMECSGQMVFVMDGDVKRLL